MSYDFYASIDSRTAVPDAYAGILADHARDPANSRDNHQKRVHAKRDSGQTGYKEDVIVPGLESVATLGLNRIDFVRFQEAFAGLPAAALEFELKLHKAWLSRDDEPFYPTENPLRKDWIFHVPMVPGSAWKGALRSAAVENLVHREAPSRDEGKAEERFRLFEIFGSEKGEDDEGAKESLKRFLDSGIDRLALVCGATKKGYKKKRADWRKRIGAAEDAGRRGRVHALPSYFDRMDLDVINPRNPATRAGTVPIKMEHAPPGARAWFGLLYLAFDLIGEPPKDIRAAARRDWELIGQALVRMLHLSGFGAKKTAGCGHTSPDLAGFQFRSTIEGFSCKIEGDKTTVDKLASLGGWFGEAE